MKNDRNLFLVDVDRKKKFRVRSVVVVAIIIMGGISEDMSEKSRDLCRIAFCSL